MNEEPVDFAILKEEWRPSPLVEVSVHLFAVDPARGDQFVVMIPSDVLRLVRVANGIVNNARNIRGVPWKAACLPSDEVIALQRENDGLYVLCETLSYTNH